MESPMTQTSPNRRCFEITKYISIYTYDIDYAGHVSNIAYFRWLEEMRFKLFEENFPMKGFVDQGLLPIIASSSIEYKRSVTLFDKPIGHMWLDEVRAASVLFKGEIRLNGEVTTIASHVGLFVSKETMRPVRLPREIADKYRELTQASSLK